MPKRYRIGIDARFYGPEGKGLGRYTERLIRHLERIESPFDFYIFLRRENWNEYQPAQANFHKVLAPYRWYSVAEQTGWPIQLAKQRLDLMHFAHFNVPVWYPGRFVVTIHDLILTRFPTERASTLGPIRYWIKHAASRFVLKSAARRAKRIITVSQFSRSELKTNLGLSEAKIDVIAEGCEPLTDEANISPPPGADELAGPFAMYVGNAYPHKNLERLLEAWVRLKSQGRSEKLLIIGRRDYFINRLEHLAERLGLQPNRGLVRFPGYVTDGQLRWLYQHATLYLFPSLMEGFGLPALEAMQEGLPVAAAACSCLPEVLGEAAAYFDPSNPKAIAQTVAELFDNPGRRRYLAERGRDQARRYNWAGSARQTLAVYQTALTVAD